MNLKMKIIVATKNRGKVKEIGKIFADLGLEVVTQEEAQIDIDVEETGDTFEKNALIKARAVSMLCDDIVIADDSGLCVEALNGRPGVYSARYAGPDASDSEKIDKLLSEMENAQNRVAKFMCCVALVTPDGREFVSHGEVMGKILHAPEGENGFGYDPVFFSDELQKSFALATPDEKNSISHRGRALRAMYEQVKELEIL